MFIVTLRFDKNRLPQRSESGSSFLSVHYTTKRLIVLRQSSTSAQARYDENNHVRDLPIAVREPAGRWKTLVRQISNMVVLIVSCLSGSRGLAKYDETFGRVVYRKKAGTTFRPLRKTVLVET
ncbi:hypothetical protein Y032_0092g2518 [Ancylostoma ceylanicum]|uniref:Uncharacterized protein n=1 Tax=Ancylostoma ceylanicum TaxID=53326 RepID=A0A016TLL7_9BILA|nr:hypothetical protein Y032_0092g2518 [Ancylostoma ceylanicum]